ncbi:hypothetical protein V501_02840 [Pseudogymnoascus sp. VKM F-4519 (FW-2642)]|nr:hypothetical protein V501_02840 [Pseudogymnoascus sp. VKM F-4519 (FW-2642)]
MRSSLFFLVAGAIGFACARPQTDDLSGCKDVTSLSTCIQPLTNALDKCTDASCACGVLKTELDCFKNYCPEVTIPASATDEYNKECTGSNAKGAASMLAIPGVGLVAGVAGVMAML